MRFATSIFSESQGPNNARRGRLPLPSPIYGPSSDGNRPRRRRRFGERGTVPDPGQSQSAVARHRVGHRHRHRLVRPGGLGVQLPRRVRGPAGGVRQHPRPLEACVLHRHPGADPLGFGPDVVPGEELGAWRTGPADHQSPQPEEAAGGLPVRCLHADPDAGTRRRHHALADLLQLHHPAGGHHRAGDQPPGPGEPEVPQRQRI